MKLDPVAGWGRLLKAVEDLTATAREQWKDVPGCGGGGVVVGPDFVLLLAPDRADAGLNENQSTMVGRQDAGPHISRARDG
jgi:hypothetical protein